MSEPVFSIEDATFSYESGRGQTGIENVSIAGWAGEVILLVGESGGGKTTITKLVNGLIPHYNPGSLAGAVKVGGLRVPETELHQVSQHVGSVFQNPRSQFFTTDTTSELAFACENQGIEKQEILRRINVVSQELDVEELLGRSIFRLSGGERQRIACAAASTIGPSLYVLDEPSSNLDMAGIEQLRRAIENWKDAGKTILIAEHRIFYLRELVDRMILVRDGCVVRTFTGDEVRRMTNADMHAMGLRAVVLQEGREDPGPSSGVSDGPAATTVNNGSFRASMHGEHPAVIENMHFRYRRNEEPVLSIDRLELPRHGIIALIGKNGAGKSTFSLCLAGLMRTSKAALTIDQATYSGKQLSGVSYMVMQDVNHQLFTEDVLDEILLSMSNPQEKEARKILASLNLEEFEDRHPMSLSGGEKQRVAIAAAMAAQRKLLIYDEPTSGLDLRHMREVADVMREMQQAGMMQIVITHDPELIETCCTHAIELEQGRMDAPYSLNRKGLRRMYTFFNQFSA